jgi:hypothetical protein
MNRKSLQLAAAMTAALASGAAQAGLVSLSNITATWYDGVPAANVTYAGNGTAAPTARWGTGGTNGVQSGYDFTVASQPIDFIVPPAPSPNQVLGTFTHQNFAINAGSSITGIKLRVTSDVSIDSILVASGLDFEYSFSHFETDNGANPCANGGPNNSGVNANGCADRVIANWLSSSDSFTVGADKYTLNVLGFSTTPDGANPFTQFWTAEKLANVAYLVANVDLLTSVDPDLPVPVPGSLSLMGIGMLGGLVVSRRRKQAKAGK